MRRAQWLGGALLVLVLESTAQGQEVPAPYMGMSYQEARTWHEQFLRGEPTKAERLEAMRSLIKASRFGERGLERIYKNFEGKYAIDPRIPGVEKTALLQMSGSTSQTKGYRRELLYATAFHNDPRFGLEAMNRPLGNTDADLVARHKSSGLYGRVEVKDYVLSSQTTNTEKLKTQIDKMAAEGRATGRPQFWVNRHGVSPVISDYAARRGVTTIGNVKSGSKQPGTISSREATDIVSSEFDRASKGRSISGGTQLAFGVLLLLDSAPELWADVQSLRDASALGTNDWLRMSQSGVNALAGVSLITSGSALAVSPLAREGLQARLYSVGRWGGFGALAFFGVGEGIAIVRYSRGDVTSREFWTQQWILGTSGAGAWAGAGAGRLVDLLPWKIPGASSVASGLGGLTGGWIGKRFGELTAEAHYNRKFAELDRAYGEAVYARYGVN